MLSIYGRERAARELYLPHAVSVAQNTIKWTRYLHPHLGFIDPTKSTSYKVALIEVLFMRRAMNLQ